MSIRYALCLLILLSLYSLAYAQIDPRLLRAINQNTPANVEAALKAGASPNSTDSLGATPLMWACFKADTAVVQMLVKAGAKTQCRGVIRTDTSNYYGNLTGLAAGLNKLPLLRYLLETLKLPVNESEYNSETKKNDGWTPVEWAAANGHLAVLTYLAEHGADLSIGRGNPMALAVSRKHSDIMAFLLEQGLVLPKDHPRYDNLFEAYTTQLFIVSQTFEKQGNFRSATSAYEYLMVIYVETVTEENAVYATLLSKLAGLYESSGQYEKALSVYLHCLAIREKAQGKLHPDYASSLNNLAALYQAMGQYEKALPLLLAYLPIQEKALGKIHPDYATTLNRLASLYEYIGQYEKALPLFLDCVTIQEKAQSKLHTNYARALNNLAGLYQEMGQYQKALPLFLDCLTITEKAIGKLHPDYATTLNNLAVVYEAMKQYQKALPLYLECLNIREKKYGKLHPDYAATLNNLALVYEAMKQYQKALPLYLECLAIQEKTYGKLNPFYASTLNNLAYLYWLMGQYEKALPLYLECLTIVEKTQDKYHPDYTGKQMNLARLYESMGQYEKALPLLIAASQQYKTQLLQNITVLNETALAQFQQKFDEKDVTYSLGYTAHATALLGQHYNDALLSKGVGLIAGQQLNRLLTQTTDSVTARIAAQLRDTKQRINQQLTHPLASQRGLDSLQQQADALEQTLVLRLPEYGQAFNALHVEWPQVQQALKPDQAAIEFVAFRYFHKHKTDSTFYAALVLRPGWATPKLVFLSEEKQLDSLIATGGSERRAAYVERLYTTADRGGVVASADGKPRRSLYSLVWQPIDSLLTGVKRVYYAPTGLLHRLNLAALPLSRSQRLADKYQLTLLASTRQLALPADKRPTNSRALLMGNIRYELDSLAYRKANARFKTSEAIASRGPSVMAFDSTSRGGSFWEELENTGQEVRIASGLLRGRGYQTDTLSGLAASEEAFYYLTRPSAGSPRVIHMATHGFFYDAPKSTTALNSNREPKPAFIESKNALVRSGLVLAGGNYSWQGGRIPAGQEDGVLTAYEISLLDLRQTELVVLSACETGLGDLNGSEGVYGLQRAFKMAGVRNLVMSLWQVPDKATRVLMEKFYGYYAGENQPVRVAFDRAVADVQALYSEPFFWAGFVLVE